MDLGQALEAAKAVFTKKNIAYALIVFAVILLLIGGFTWYKVGQDTGVYTIIAAGLLGAGGYFLLRGNPLRTAPKEE